MSYEQSNKTLLQTELEKAAAVLQVDVSALSFMFVDWTGNESWFQLGSGGTAGYLNGAAEASLAFASSGAGSGTNAFMTLRGTTAASYASFLPGGSGGEFYLATRQKIATAVDAQANVGLSCASETLTIGVLGSVSATKFTATFPTGTMTSSVDVDTSWHTHRVSRKSSSSIYTIDDANPIAGNVYPSTPYGLSLFAGNGSTAALRTLHSDWVLCAFPRQT